MCFNDPVNDHGVPQSRLLLYLADQRPKHRNHYGKGGRYGTELRTAGRGWRGRDDPFYRPRDDPPPSEHRGDGSNRGGRGAVYPPHPPQGGGGRVRGEGGDSGRATLPAGLNVDRGNVGGRNAGGRNIQGGRNLNVPVPQNAQRLNGGNQGNPPIVRDFAVNGGRGVDEPEPEVPNLRFDTHTTGTPTVFSSSSSRAGSDTGAARPSASLRGGGNPAPDNHGSRQSRNIRGEAGAFGNGPRFAPTSEAGEVGSERGRHARNDQGGMNANRD